MEKEEQGEWYPLDGPCEGIDVKLRSPHCDDFQRLQASYQQKQRVFNAAGEIDTLALDRVFRRCIGECLLIDWRGLGGPEGPSPWSAEMASDLMRKHAYRKVSARISVLVRRIGGDEEVERAAEGKGFAQPSAIS